MKNCFKNALRRHRDIAAPASPYAVLELFAGAGGMSTGFEMAGLEVVCASDNCPEAAETYRRNHPNTKFVLGDIRKKEVKERIVEAFGERECEILAGGIPCVAFSTAGKRDPNDPRGRLYEDFFEMVRMLNPKIVLIENVVGIKSMVHPRTPYWDTNAAWLKNVEPGTHEATLLDYVVNEKVGWKINRRLGELGYYADCDDDYECRILTASDYGVPQKRRRVIFQAIRNDLPLAAAFPEPTHGPGLAPWVTVREAIGDLTDWPEDVEWSHVFSKHNPAHLERIRNTPVGSSLYPNYSDAFYRQPPDQPARTVKEHHGEVFIHYARPRVMTPRELARLQSFPDDYLFCGPKGKVLVQIGNAVPTLLAKAIGIRLRQMLDSLNDGTNGQIA